MAQLVTAIGGAAIGSLYGNPWAGFQYGWAVGGLLFPQKRTQRNPGQQMGDIGVMDSQYGIPIRRVWGSCRVGGNVIWAAPITEEAHEESESAGKGNTIITTSYSYSGSFAVGLCRGPIVGVRRIWGDDILIWDAREDSTGATQIEGDWEARVYLGDGSGSQDPLIVLQQGGAQNVPGYLDLAYVVFEGLPLARFGNRLPQITAEVVGSGTVSDVAVDTVTLPASPVSLTPCNGMIWAMHGNSATKVNPATGTVINTVALTGAAAPQGAAANGADLWIAAEGTHKAARITSGVLVEELATSLDDPWGVGVWGSGTDAYICLTHDDTPGGLTRFWWDSKKDKVWEELDSIALAAGSNGIAIAGNYAWVSCAGTSTIQKVAISGAALSIADTVDLGAGAVPGAIAYDATNGLIWVADVGSNMLVKINATTGNYDLAIPIPGADITAVVVDEPELAGGLPSVWVATGSSKRLYKISTSSFAITDTYTLDHEISCACFYAGYLWLGWGDAAGMEKWGRSRLTMTAPTLASVVEDILKAAGLAAADIDVTGLGSSVTLAGFVLEEQTPAAQALRALQDAYAFDVWESDWQIKAAFRSPITWTAVPWADLGAQEHQPGEPAPEPTDRLTSTITPPDDPPRTVNVTYLAEATDYQQATQPGTRIGGSGERAETLALPLVLTAAEARTIAYREVYSRLEGRQRYQLTLPPKWAKLEPHDCLSITSDAGATYYMRVDTVDYGGGLVRIEAVAEVEALYSRTDAGEEGEEGGGGIDPIGPTDLLVCDIPDPAGAAGLTSPRLYIAVASEYGAWPGARVYKSPDNWSTYAAILPDWAPPAATMGVATTALADVAEWRLWDEAGSVTVRLTDDSRTLSSITKAQALNWGNLCLLGDELLIFRTATLVSPGVYTLSGLLRGRRGSEWACGNHIAGDRFVLLSTARAYDAPMSDRGALLSYRAVTLGTLLADAPRLDCYNMGVALKPLAPCRLRAAWAGSGDITLTWVRRARQNAEWLDLADVPLDEAAEAYTVLILDGAGGSTVRAFTPSTASQVYTAAQQTADFGAPQDHLHVSISQLSAVVGDGWAAEATL